MKVKITNIERSGNVARIKYQYGKSDGAVLMNCDGLDDLEDIAARVGAHIRADIKINGIILLLKAIFEDKELDIGD